MKRALDRERPSAARRGYGPRWREGTRRLPGAAPAVRRLPGPGPRGAGDVVDHVVPHRGDQQLFWDESNWAPACKPCHDAKTAREGRWG